MGSLLVCNKELSVQLKLSSYSEALKPTTNFLISHTTVTSDTTSSCPIDNLALASSRGSNAAKEAEICPLGAETLQYRASRKARRTVRLLQFYIEDRQAVQLIEDHTLGYSCLSSA